MIRYPVLLAAILVLAACADLTRGPEPAACPVCPPATAPVPRAGEARFTAVSFGTLPGWGSAEILPGLRAFAGGCSRLASPFLRRACDRAAAIPQEEGAARRFVEENFEAWSVSTAESSASGLVTGYYEPVISGSRTPTERFRLPVYGVPADLVQVDLEQVAPEVRGLRLRGRLDGNRLVPYWTRADIDAGRARPPVLAWVEDAVELMFLQIQGSGQVELAGGGRLRLAYADHNGHPYRSIGRFLVDRGELKLEQASMQGIKAWIAANPVRAREALDSNPSYVFFREMPESGGAGPAGTLGVPLTAGYSIAIDARQLPLGAPVFLSTTMPLSTQPLQRLVAAQDTGGAIRGAVRADFFWGTGPEAGALAGRMRQQGSLWVLWPRGDGPPRP